MWLQRETNKLETGLEWVLASRTKGLQKVYTARTKSKSHSRTCEQTHQEATTIHRGAIKYKKHISTRVHE